VLHQLCCSGVLEAVRIGVQEPAPTPAPRRPSDFEPGNVLHQLRCGGVLEAVRISCAGFPTKLPFEDFVDHFWNLVPELLARPELDDAALARAIAAKAHLTGYQAGKTKARGRVAAPRVLCACWAWEPTLVREQAPAHLQCGKARACQ